MPASATAALATALPIDHGVGSTDHFSALKIWMFENKFVSLPSHLKTIEPMDVHRELRTMRNTETSKSDQ